MLMTYDASVEVMNKQKLFPAEQTVHDSALQTQQQEWVKRGQFYRFTHWISILFLFWTILVRFWWQAGSWGEGDWPVLYHFMEGEVSQVLYIVTWGKGVLKKWHFCYIICGRPRKTPSGTKIIIITCIWRTSVRSLSLLCFNLSRSQFHSEILGTPTSKSEASEFCQWPLEQRSFSRQHFTSIIKLGKLVRQFCATCSVQLRIAQLKLHRNTHKNMLTNSDIKVSTRLEKNSRNFSRLF